MPLSKSAYTIKPENEDIAQDIKIQENLEIIY